VGYTLLKKLRALEQSPEGLRCDIVEWKDLDEEASVREQLLADAAPLVPQMAQRDALDA